MREPGGDTGGESSRRPPAGPAPSEGRQGKAALVREGARRLPGGSSPSAVAPESGAELAARLAAASTEGERGFASKEGGLSGSRLPNERLECCKGFQHVALFKIRLSARGKKKPNKYFSTKAAIRNCSLHSGQHPLMVKWLVEAEGRARKPIFC